MWIECKSSAVVDDQRGLLDHSSEHFLRLGDRVLDVFLRCRAAQYLDVLHRHLFDQVDRLAAGFLQCRRRWRSGKNRRLPV
ncbi:MAG: hypothetical protein R3B90_21720 [Planctomycetaceae bacterium]